jgi:hypothetical protein
MAVIDLRSNPLSSCARLAREQAADDEDWPQRTACLSAPRSWWHQAGCTPPRLVQSRGVLPASVGTPIRMESVSAVVRLAHQLSQLGADHLETRRGMLQGVVHPLWASISAPPARPPKPRRTGHLSLVMWCEAGDEPLATSSRRQSSTRVASASSAWTGWPLSTGVHHRPSKTGSVVTQFVTQTGRRSRTAGPSDFQENVRVHKSPLQTT